MHPGAPETCNGVDDDCNGVEDDNAVDALTWYRDLDADLYGDPGQTLLACAQPAGYVGNGDDCDDSAPEVHPGAVDLPDPLFADSNCDGIDGDVDRAAFVAVGGANDGLCALAAPCASVGHAAAVVAADPARDQVYVSAGSYPGAFDLPDGVAIHGGYDTGWVRADRAVPGHLATLQGGFHAGSALFLTVRALNAVASLSDLRLVGPLAVGQSGGRGQSSQVVHAQGSALDILRVDLVQGDGAGGSAGAAGSGASQIAPPAGGAGEAGLRQSFACDTYRPAGGPGATNATCPSGGTGGGDGGSGGSMDTSCFLGTCDICTATLGLSGQPSSDGTNPGGTGGGLCFGVPPARAGAAPSPSMAPRAVAPRPTAASWARPGTGTTAAAAVSAPTARGWWGRRGRRLRRRHRRARPGRGRRGRRRLPRPGGGGGGGVAAGASASWRSEAPCKWSTAPSCAAPAAPVGRGRGGTGPARRRGWTGRNRCLLDPRRRRRRSRRPGRALRRRRGGGGGRACGILSLGAAVTSTGNTFSGGTAGTAGPGGPSPGFSGSPGAPGNVLPVCTCASASGC
ncbi:MAG: putative metal-binding motif-containing protein [Thermoanaerobaculia bacterium]|nr:putative metal-binding motif-containing protein [Thermoanaerobaculia bacterium]